ncbi:MAG TPA: DUF4012 domain-containing protein, partial [Actinomycetota bacterium]
MARGNNLTFQTERVRVKERVRIRRRRRKGPWIASAAAVVLIAAGLLALSYLPARTARARLFDAKNQLEQGRSELFAGRIPEAIGHLNQARESSIQATSDSRNPLLRVVGWLPILGRTPDAITALAESSESVAEASVAVAKAIEQVPGGIASLAPHGGRLPLEPLARLAPAVDQASLLVHGAYLDLAETAGGMLPGSVANARHQGLAQLGALDRTLSLSAAMMRRLPGFFGANGPKRYFFGAQSPAELRGTGGLIGTYAILTMKNGRPEFSQFRPIEALPNYELGAITAPSPDYARNYNQFGGAGFWLNINMTPDFPTAAGAILKLYAKGTGDSLDGVVLADPFALKSLLDVTGPVTVRPLGVRVDAANVVDYTANRAYASFKDQDLRKLVLGEVAKTVFDDFLSRSGSPSKSLRALFDPIANGHLLLYSSDAPMENALRRSGEDGGLPEEQGDFLSIVQNNGSGSKIDFYQERTVRYDVRLGPEGTALAKTSVRLLNNAPNQGVDPYIIGPYKGVSGAGENVTFVNVYCPSSTDLTGFQRNEEEQLVVAGREHGLRFYQDYVKIPSRETANLNFGLANPNAWKGSSAGGVYRLTFRNQPTI